MEDAQWDGESESSFELVEAPDAGVISSPSLSPAPSLHEDGFEALEAGSPCSSSGGATAVLERSLCFTGMEEEAGVEAGVEAGMSSNSRASSMDGFPAAGADLCEGTADSATPEPAVAPPVAPPAATDPAPQDLPTAADPASTLPTPAAEPVAGADVTAHPMSPPLVTPGMAGAAAAAATTLATTAPLQAAAEDSFWSTPAGKRLYMALNGASSEPASNAAPAARVPAPAADLALKAMALVRLAVVLVSMGSILVSTNRTDLSGVEVAGCVGCQQHIPVQPGGYPALSVPWKQLQAPASSSHWVGIRRNRSNGTRSASNSTSITMGLAPWLAWHALGGWHHDWRPFMDWSGHLAPVEAAGNSNSNSSNWTVSTAMATAAVAGMRMRHVTGGGVGLVTPGEDSWGLPCFLARFRAMWSGTAHSNWSATPNGSPPVWTPAAIRQPHPANTSGVPTLAAARAGLQPWPPGMPAKVWYNRHLFASMGWQPASHGNTSGLPLAAACWNAPAPAVSAGRPARLEWRPTRPSPVWYLPTPPCYNLNAWAAAAPAPRVAQAHARQAGLTGWNATLTAAATGASAVSSDPEEGYSTLAGVHAAAAAMPAAQAAMPAVPNQQQQEQQVFTMQSSASSPQDQQQQQVALEAVRELVGGVLQRLRHMQQQHSTAWGRIVDLLPPHFVLELQQVANTTQSLLSHLALTSGPPSSAVSSQLGAFRTTSGVGGSEGPAGASAEGNATLPAGSEGLATDVQAELGGQCPLGGCKVSQQGPGGLMGYVLRLAAMGASASSNSRGLLRGPSSTGLVLATPRQVVPAHIGSAVATCELPATLEVSHLRDAPPHVLRAMLEAPRSLPAADTHSTPSRASPPAACEMPAARRERHSKRVRAVAAAPPPPTALHFMALPPSPHEAHPRLAPAVQAVALAPAETRYVLVERQGLLQGLVAVPQLPESQESLSMSDVVVLEDASSTALGVWAAGWSYGSNGSSGVAEEEQHASAVSDEVTVGRSLGRLAQDQQPWASTGSFNRPCRGAAAAPLGASNHSSSKASKHPCHAVPSQLISPGVRPASRHRPSAAAAAAALGQPLVVAAHAEPAARLRNVTQASFAWQHSSPARAQHKQATARGLLRQATSRFVGGQIQAAPSTAASWHVPLPAGNNRSGIAAAMPLAAVSLPASPGLDQQRGRAQQERPNVATRPALGLDAGIDRRHQLQQQPQAVGRGEEAHSARNHTGTRRHQQQQAPRQQQAGPSQRAAASLGLNGSTRSASERPKQQQQQRAHNRRSGGKQRLGCDCLNVMAPWEHLMRSVSAASLARMRGACSTQQQLLQRLVRTSQAASKRLQRHLHRWRRTLHTQGWHLGDWEHSWGAAEEMLGNSGATWAAWASDMQRWTSPVCDAAKQLQLLHARWPYRCKHCSIHDAPAARKQGASRVSLCDCSTCCNWAQPLLERLRDSQPYARLILNQLSRLSGPGQRSLGAWWRRLQQMSMQGGAEHMRAFQRAWGHKGLPAGTPQALQDLLQLLAQLPEQEAAAWA